MGISGLNAIFFCLITADLGTLGGLAAWIGDPGAGGLLPVVGIALGIIYCCFPLQFLDGRATLALSGYRILLRALLVLHVPLAILLLLALHAGADSAGDLFLTAPVSILATPGLYVIWRALVSLRWLDPAAPIETWEAMPGIDGTAMSTDGPPKQATPMAVALTLPFVAAWRARQTAMAACAGLCCGWARWRWRRSRPGGLCWPSALPPGSASAPRPAPRGRRMARRSRRRIAWRHCGPSSPLPGWCRRRLSRQPGCWPCLACSLSTSPRSGRS
ncbi:hypothetical protein Apmu_0596_02 [Acidiphilium multivorum AIU301]|uniref:hypothetical protein n=1 Tax=Acidiphilium multivorum TaxID=62140 RepID=UPI0005E44503|nr:hypothetical protein [Acidiphilium multivorum]GAN75714.1 hypothetical protein Apmu_0596_02 [Acidiphilium multivorum AIU301]